MQVIIVKNNFSGTKYFTSIQLQDEVMILFLSDELRKFPNKESPQSK